MKHYDNIMIKTDNDIQAGSNFSKLLSSPLLHVIKYFLFMEQSAALIFTEYVSYIFARLYYNIRYYSKERFKGNRWCINEYSCVKTTGRRRSTCVRKYCRPNSLS